MTTGYRQRTILTLCHVIYFPYICQTMLTCLIINIPQTSKIYTKIFNNVFKLCVVLPEKQMILSMYSIKKN